MSRKVYGHRKNSRPRAKTLVKRAKWFKATGETILLIAKAHFERQALKK